jgi:putative polyhydroxyalkanoate system protein
MASFSLNKPYTMPRDQLREKANSLAAKLEREHGLRSRWHDEDTLSIKGAGLDGRLSLAGNTLTIDITLGLLTSGFKGLVRGEIQRYLDQHIY